ncbi:MAG: excisionase family DNA binding protein [Francisellaceae bacterium]|jgi:excisionase family DNA binding protein|uniref:helix-turn-helix transcriptional regulator n=1 Tax=Colwellia sp. 12G3 TaxID=2058299 RepID=UPI000C331024|nr:helix-turn-helix domain-containing protein [Colwellia sp. 12G3]PKI12702.1 Rha family transcriptional regulator [Colwellia sp. 12G3]
MYFEEEFITQDQLARKLKVSKVTIWRMINDGRLPKMITIGARSKRWVSADINGWLQSLKHN